MDFAAADNTTREELTQQPSLLAPVLVSIGLHLLLAYGFVQSKIAPPNPARPEFISIGFQPSNPNRLVTPRLDEAVLPSKTIAEPALAQAELEGDGVDSIAPSELDVAAGSGAKQPLGPELTGQGQAETVHEPEVKEVSRSSRGAAPTSDSISRSVRELSQARQTRFYSRQCNPLEEEEGLKECAPKSNASYDALEFNAVYRAFTPAALVTRSERASAVISSRRSSVVTRLREEIPDGLSGYLIEEMEAGISHGANAGNRAVQHMIDMTDKSDAAAQARAVLGNPLLLDLKRSQQNPTRGVLAVPPR
jgi:hypothetical protein